ncbi:hypothetical protein F6B41_02790 [Microbacterium lushaniae]|nr:hypothetical protein F6B41_28495 [Microbacterium lushaniae]KAA9158832.1 hypothetical protein F6B41_02790 [Microbacterium lushaniae]
MTGFPERIERHDPLDLDGRANSIAHEWAEALQGRADTIRGKERAAETERARQEALDKAGADFIENLFNNEQENN